MSDVLDESLLEELRLVMEDEFSVLMETFLMESERQFAEVQTAWASRDMESLRRNVHSLKGSSGNIGATGLQAICAELEYKARDGAAEQIPALMTAVSTQLADVVEAVRAL